MKLRQKVTNTQLRIISKLEGESSLFRLKNYQRLIIKNSSGYHIVPFENIIYLKAESNYTSIQLDSGKKILVSRTLKTFSTELDGRFVRAHSSFYVNLLFLTSYRKSENQIILKGGISVPVSRSRKQNLETYFQ